MQCPLCNSKLQERYSGLVCKNSKCKLFHKLEIGWVYHTEDSKWKTREHHIMKFVFDINKTNASEWLKLKIQVLKRDNYTCCKCGYSPIKDRTQIKSLQVHHIMSRHEFPELTFDSENCIVLCKECHNNIHSKDKKHFKNTDNVEENIND